MDISRAQKFMLYTCVYVTEIHSKYDIFKGRCMMKCGFWGENDEQKAIGESQGGFVKKQTGVDPQPPAAHSVSGFVLLQGFRAWDRIRRGWDEREHVTESGWMGRRSVQVSPDVRLLNSRELGKVSAGHLRAVPRSHSHPFVTISGKTQQSHPQWGQQGHSRDGE